MAPPLLSTRLRQPYVPTTCVHCAVALEYLPSTPAPEEPFSLQCAACKQTWIIRPPLAKGKSGKRRIGTDEKPLDMAFYDLMGLPATATQDEIKKAYRRLAIKFHPDKNPNDPTAGEVFREIAIAYTTLSDVGLRHSYNEFGKGKGDGQSEEAMVDPEAIFSQLFGGERFLDIIGTISLGTEMKSAMQSDEEEEEVKPPALTVTVNANGTTTSTPTPLTPEAKAAKAEAKAAKEAAEKVISDEKARVREVRVKALLERLRTKIAVFTEQAQGEDDEQIASGVKTMWAIEAEELKDESYGVELLQTVGFVYASKSRHFLASTGPIPFGLGGWFHSARSTAHILSETVSTVRSAYALKDVFEALSAAEKSGLSDEKKKELEEKAAQMGLHALFKGAKLEVESIIREVSDRLLSEPVPLPDLRKRAVALGLLGAVYESVKKNEEAPESILPGTTPAPKPKAKTAPAVPPGRPTPKPTPTSTPKPYARTGGSTGTANPSTSWM